MPDEPLVPPDAESAPGGTRDTPPAAAPAENGERADALRAEAGAREAAEAQERYLRTLADFDNYRKRTERGRTESRRQAQEQVLREILPVLDNFDRALTVAPGPDADAGFRAGVELIHRDFLKALERVGVRPFSSLGELFDPQRHEAVGRVERGDVADQTIVEEILRGYLYHERVLRPAQVIVALEPTPPPEPGEASA